MELRKDIITQRQSFLWDVEERALLINVYLCFKKDNKYSWRLRISVVWRESLAFEYISISFSLKQIWWLSTYISTSEIIWRKKHLRQVFQNIIVFWVSVFKIHKDYYVVEKQVLRRYLNIAFTTKFNLK